MQNVPVGVVVVILLPAEEKGEKHENYEISAEFSRLTFS